jgi:hypothetical protein
VGANLQRTSRDHATKHDCQLRASLAEPATELDISRCARDSDWRCSAFIPPCVRQWRHTSHRRCYLISFMFTNWWQGEYPPIRARSHSIPVSCLVSDSSTNSQKTSFIRNSCAQKLGFSNAELLQDTDWDKVKLDPRRAAPKLPKWVWSHDPEAYAYENYALSAESLKKGIDMKDEDAFEPNYPKGYKYEPWSIENIMEDMRAGKPIDLGPGDWE